jgi:hypothetical protein
VPVLEVLEPARSLRPVNPLHEGAYAFQRIENTRLARYARDFLTRLAPPAPEGISSQLQKDIEVSKLRLVECRQPREQDVWLHSLVNVARTMNPYLPAAEADAAWARIATAPCHDGLHEFQRRWIALFRAVGQRDAARMGQLAELLLATQTDIGFDHREYLLLAGMSGHLASGAPSRALALWDQYASRLSQAARGQPLFRLLRCRAQADTCAAAFPAQAG